MKYTICISAHGSYHFSSFILLFKWQIFISFLHVSFHCTTPSSWTHWHSFPCHTLSEKTRKDKHVKTTSSQLCCIQRPLSLSTVTQFQPKQKIDLLIYLRPISSNLCSLLWVCQLISKEVTIYGILVAWL